MTLWLVDLDERATRERAEAVALVPGEATLVAGRHNAGERLLRRRLARLLLATAGGCRADAVTLARSLLGAPLVVVPAGWHCSVAARWPVCLIGVAPRPLGVEVERIERDRAPALDQLTPRERHLLGGDADPARFFARAWAAKESHAKWTGEPLAVDPALVEAGEASVASPWGTTACWRHERGDLVAAVCAAG